MAPPNSSIFSVNVVLPASGCEIMAKVRRRETSSISVMRAKSRIFVEQGWAPLARGKAQGKSRPLRFADGGIRRATYDNLVSPHLQKKVPWRQPGEDMVRPARPPSGPLANPSSVHERLRACARPSYHSRRRRPPEDR